MKDKLLLIWKHLKPENLQKMWLQSKWIWQYGKRYWKSMVVYTPQYPGRPLAFHR